MFNAKKITTGIKYAVSTGNWGIQKQSSQNGVAQILTRMNYLAGISHLRRINTPINREGKLPKPRQLSASHCGVLCPVETPEGQACGLVENLALLAHTRLGYNGSCVADVLLSRGWMLPLSVGKRGHWRVAINGSLEGVTEDGLALVCKLRQCRMNLMLPLDTSIATHPDQRIVSVDTDAGCLLRPLFVKSELHALPKLMRTVPPYKLWNELLVRGVVQLIDKNEEKNIEIGSTHMELHPSCLLGICAGMIPFLNHNQAPRNTRPSFVELTVSATHPHPHRMVQQLKMRSASTRQP